MNPLHIFIAVALGVCAGLLLRQIIVLAFVTVLERYRARQARKHWELIMAQDTPFSRAVKHMADGFAQAFGPTRLKSSKPTERHTN